MKKFLTTAALLCTMLVAGQSHRTVVHLGDNTYRTVVVEGTIKQTGYYVKDGETLSKTGTWKLYADGRLLTRATYRYGKLYDITIWENGQRKYVNNHALEVAKLHSKIRRLESLTAM